MDLISHDAVYQACTIAGVLGIAVWLASHQMGSRHLRKRQGAVLNKTSGTGTYEGVLTLWGKELCFTWLGTLLCSVVPAVLFGSGVFSIGVLVVAVLVGIPFAVFGCVRAKGLAKRGMRRLAVMLAVPSLTLGYVFQVDEQIPKMRHRSIKPSNPSGVKPTLSRIVGITYSKAPS